MNVAMDRHREEGEEDPNRAVGEEEAVDEIGIEEGIGTGIGEIDRGILVGRREAGGEVVLGGVNDLGHENFLQVSTSIYDVFENRWTLGLVRSDRDEERFVVALMFMFTSLRI